MPGIVDRLLGRDEPEQVAQQEAPQPVDDGRVPNPHVYFNEELLQHAQRQMNAQANNLYDLYANQAPAPVQWGGAGIGQANFGVVYQQPWEFRQQVFPQPVETRLSAADVEKIAQRIILLWEERIQE